MIKAIFLDFDGTISDAKKIAYESMVLAFDDFGYRFDEKRLRGLMGIKMRLILKELGLPPREVKKVRTRFYRYFSRAAINGGIKPCVSLKPLWELKKDYPLIVISNSREKFLKMSIGALGLKGLFRWSYGSEKFREKDDILRKLFRKMKIRPSEAIYVGDRFSDVGCARDSGCVAIAIHNKCAWSDLKMIKKEKPDYIIKDFYGLKKIINSIDR